MTNQTAAAASSSPAPSEKISPPPPLPPLPAIPPPPTLTVDKIPPIPPIPKEPPPPPIPESEMIHVHIVPHSHDDVGWQVPPEIYYHTKVVYIITSVVKALLADPKRKFS